MRLINADALIAKWEDDAEKMEDPIAVMFTFAAINDAKHAQTVLQWIPCSERLPDNEKRVLCTVQSGEHFCVVPCIFIQHTRRWLPEVYGNHDNVIAWMPLPEPWNGGQDD